MESRILGISHLIIGAIVFIIGSYQLIQSIMQIPPGFSWPIAMFMTLGIPVLIGLGFILSGWYYWKE